MRLPPHGAINNKSGPDKRTRAGDHIDADAACASDAVLSGTGGRIVGSAVLRGSGVVVSLVLNLLLASSLAPEAFGAYAFIVALFNLAMVGCVFATDLLLTRHAHRIREQRLSMRGLLLPLIIPTALRTVVCWCALVVALAALWSGPLVGPVLYGALLPGLLVFAWLHIVSAFHRASGAAIAGSLGVFLVRPALMLLALVTLGASGKALDTATVIWLYLASGVVALFVAGYRLHGGAQSRHAIARMDGWLQGQTALGWSTLTTNVLSRSDSIVLPALLSPTQFGIYSLGRYVIDASHRVIQLINVQLGPELVVKYRAGGLGALRALYFYVVLFGLLALTTGLGLWFLLGEQYLAVHTSFPRQPTFAIVATILAWGVVSAAIGPLFLVYKVLGSPRTIFQAQVGIGIGTLIAFSLLTQAYGLWGAVAALIISAAAPPTVAAILLYGRRLSENEQT